MERNKFSKTLVIVLAVVLVFAFASTSFATSYTSWFNVSSNLTGTTRNYTGGNDMGINCYDTELLIDPGYWLKQTPTTYKVTLYKNGVSQGTVAGFPISASTYNGKWYGKGPGSSTIPYYYKFTAVNTLETNGDKLDYATIHGHGNMYSE